MTENHPLASAKPLTVDVDGHVMEPADTWQKYIDPAFRDRALRIETDENGYEVLLLDNKPLEYLRGRMGALGGINLDPAELMTAGKISYADGSPPGGYDPAARIAVMDDEGIDISMLYPTLGISWEDNVKDPALANAYSMAYNRWLVDFCSHDTKRLIPVAHICLLDPIAAAAEATRARKAGCVSALISPDMDSREGKYLDDPSYDIVWATLQDLDMPMAFHVVARERPFYHKWVRPEPAFLLFNFAFIATDVMAAFTQLLTLGMLEKYPGLRCAVLETGANWIASWLERLDHKFEVAANTPIKMLPSEYFRRQCIVSADPDETMTADVAHHVGPEYFVWASDYPHIDASLGSVKEISGNIAALPDNERKMILGENALRYYGLSRP